MPRTVLDTKPYAVNLRKTFTAKPLRRGEYDVGVMWPTSLVHVGTCESVMYSSDKWYEDGEFIDYKHVAEGPQKLYVNSNLAGHKWSGKRVKMCEPLPSHVAELAPCLGIQSVLHDGKAVQISIPNCILFGTRTPVGKVPFLVLAVPGDMVCAIVTGEELDVTSDGIVGLPPWHDVAKDLLRLEAAEDGRLQARHDWNASPGQENVRG